jgi:hypothetical protein
MDFKECADRMIKDYCNQTTTLKTLSSLNQYGEPSFSSSTIACRFEQNTKLIIDREGKEVISTAAIFSESEIKEDDRVSYGGVERVVLFVEPGIGLSGDIEFYEARL